nr:MAG: hypothetical protein H2RhizoLitter492015_000002 [Mitovirus sp.]
MFGIETSYLPTAALWGCSGTGCTLGSHGGDPMRNGNHPPTRRVGHLVTGTVVIRIVSTLQWFQHVTGVQLLHISRPCISGTWLDWKPNRIKVLWVQGNSRSRKILFGTRENLDPANRKPMRPRLPKGEPSNIGSLTKLGSPRCERANVRVAHGNVGWNGVGWIRL